MFVKVKGSCELSMQKSSYVYEENVPSKNPYRVWLTSLCQPITHHPYYTIP